jgi:hypothetical protein
MQRPISFFTRQGSFGRDKDNNINNIRRGKGATLIPAVAADDPPSFSYPKQILSGSEFISFGHYDDCAMDMAGATPNADELSSFSSNPNSLEASWNGSSYPYRSETHHDFHQQPHEQKAPPSFSKSHKLSHRHVLTPPSPSREHVPKRPRFAVDGLNVVESLIHNIISSCGCVSSTAVVPHRQDQQQHKEHAHTQRASHQQSSLKPPFTAVHGFASRPFGFKNHDNHSSNLLDRPDDHNYDNHYQEQHDGKKLYLSYPPPMIKKTSFALADPPKVRRLTMKDASKNDLDVTFLMH